MVWFTYTEIKFIPDTIKDETVNVGVLVVDEKGNTRSKFIKNFDQISKRYSVDDVDLLKAILPTYGENKNKNPKHLQVLHEKSIQNHRIKISSPRAVNSSSIDAAVDEIYSMMISISSKNISSGSYRKHVHSIEKILKNKKLPQKYIKKQHDIGHSTIKSKYDFVFQNGMVSNVLQIISFDIHDKEKSLFKSKSFAYDAYYIKQFNNQIECIAYVPTPKISCTQYEQSYKVLNESQYCKLANENNIDDYLTKIVKLYPSQNSE